MMLCGPYQFFRDSDCPERERERDRETERLTQTDRHKQTDRQTERREREREEVGFQGQILLVS